jgi:hypothetical protein
MVMRCRYRCRQCIRSCGGYSIGIRIRCDVGIKEVIVEVST